MANSGTRLRNVALTQIGLENSTKMRSMNSGVGGGREVAAQPRPNGWRQPQNPSLSAKRNTWMAHAGQLRQAPIPGEVTERPKVHDWKSCVRATVPCLLYTSDAADEEDSVDLGGRRIIKKKKKNT